MLNEDPTLAATEALPREPAPRDRLPETGGGSGMPFVQPIGRVNWIGLWTLYSKEVHRFAKVFAQTILAPTITTLVFLAIFSLALGGAVRTVAGVPFLSFLTPGLVMMAIVQNAFANTSSSFMVGKIQGSIVDILLPPLSPAELTFAFALGGVTRGVLVGIAVTVAASIFVSVSIHSVALALFYAVAASLMLSLIGLLAGIWADKFDHMAAITNFVITPLAFLSGTFYSVDRLPEPWYTISQFNPFFYMIDGIRYAFIGRSDSSLIIGASVLIACNLVLIYWCHRWFAIGYKLKD